MDYETIAKQILQHIGGKENVITLIHCMTRLRFTLKDESIVDDEAMKKTKGVVGVMKKAGQYKSKYYLSRSKHSTSKKNSIKIWKTVLQMKYVFPLKNSTHSAIKNVIH